MGWRSVTATLHHTNIQLASRWCVSQDKFVDENRLVQHVAKATENRNLLL